MKLICILPSWLIDSPFIVRWKVTPNDSSSSRNRWPNLCTHIVYILNEMEDAIIKSNLLPNTYCIFMIPPNCITQRILHFYESSIAFTTTAWRVNSPTHEQSICRTRFYHVQGPQSLHGIRKLFRTTSICVSSYSSTAANGKCTSTRASLIWYAQEIQFLGRCSLTFIWISGCVVLTCYFVLYYLFFLWLDI